MKKIVFLLIIFLLYSCDLDKSIDSDSEIDKDDINIIDEVGNQSIDKAIDLFNTKTFAS